MLAYLGRYTHRVAIANSRLISLSEGKVRFTWKDYRQDGKIKMMTLEADEFIRRFLLHTGRLPSHPPLWLPRQWRTPPRALSSATCDRQLFSLVQTGE